MTTTPYWFDSATCPKFRPLGRSMTVDVLVVGAGVTGIMTTYFLKQAGSRVALVERRRIAYGDSGHTTAHLTCVTDIRLHELVKSFGRRGAQATWDAGNAAIDEIQNIVRSKEIDCEYSRVPGYLHAPVDGGHSDHRSGLKKDAKFANEFGFDAVYCMALGAQRRQILQLVLRRSLRVVILGLLVGVLAAFGATRLLASLLYGVGVNDIFTYVSVVFLLGASALLASYIPARRATRVDPMVALRYE